MRDRVRVLLSACLNGSRCQYDGRRPSFLAFDGSVDIVPVCPEVDGGLGVPRPRAEIVGGDGNDVLDGRARVVTVDGDDVTAEYVEGAQRALETALRNSVQVAVLQDVSPSCGATSVNDGTFTRTRKDGVGVTSALLARHGIQVFAHRPGGSVDSIASGDLRAAVGPDQPLG